jgi:hypothetical protein
MVDPESLSFLVLDPGQVTGWSHWAIEPDLPMLRLQFGVIPGGFDGFLDWLESNLAVMGVSLLICERFNPELGTGGSGKDYVGMEIQGAVKAVCRALGIEVMMFDVGMKAECTDDALKRAGLWIENSEVEWEDARDVNDTQRLAHAYAKMLDHEPTIRAIWPPM